MKSRCSNVRRFVVLLAVWVLSVNSLQAQGTYNRVLAIGEDAPGWEDLPGTDGRQHSLGDLKQAAVIVVCFTSNTCLYSIDYEDRLIALHEQFAGHPQGVRLIAINSNAVDDDALAPMQQRAEEKGFCFPYLKDDDQSVAKAWGAVYTPEFFVLNARRQVVYMGAMDDNTDDEKVTARYVEQAIAATLKGEPIETKETPARGCTIRFPRRRAPEPDPISKSDR